MLALVKGNSYKTTAENFEEDQTKTGDDQLDTNHQELAVKNKMSMVEQFLEELLKKMEKCEKLGNEVKTLNSSLYEAETKVHHLQKRKQELAQRFERYQDRVLDQHIAEVGEKKIKK